MDDDTELRTALRHACDIADAAPGVAAPGWVATETIRELVAEPVSTGDDDDGDEDDGLPLVDLAVAFRTGEPGDPFQAFVSRVMADGDGDYWPTSAEASAMLDAAHGMMRRLDPSAYGLWLDLQFALLLVISADGWPA